VTEAMVLRLWQRWTVLYAAFALGCICDRNRVIPG
jgi:hypothetical protein